VIPGKGPCRQSRKSLEWDFELARTKNPSRLVALFAQRVNLRERFQKERKAESPLEQGGEARGRVIKIIERKLMGGGGGRSGEKGKVKLCN